MWEVKGKPVPGERFQPFTTCEVLYAFDGPRTFTLRDADGELHLAHWLDEDRERARFVVVPFSERLLADLKAGRLSVRDALDQPRVFALDLGQDSAVLGGWRVELADLPADALPRQTTMLWPHLEPLASVRAIGERVEVGVIPPAVVRSVADSLPRAFRTVLDYVLGTIPDELAQRLRAHPPEPLAQRVCLASFEISFRLPAPEHSLFDGVVSSDRGVMEAAIERSGALLRRGLEWATSNDATAEHLHRLADSEEETRVILAAIENLMPSARGPIQTIELRGAWLGAPTRPRTLGRANRRAVAGALRELPHREPHKLRLTGRIRELDKDRLSFELRDILETGVQTRKFTYDDFLFDDVQEAFDWEGFVRVTGFQTASNRPAVAFEITPVQG